MHGNSLQTQHHAKLVHERLLLVGQRIPPLIKGITVQLRHLSIVDSDGMRKEQSGFDLWLATPWGEITVAAVRGQRDG